MGDRALPVNLDLDIANAANTGQEAARFDIFAMCDCIIYIDLAGKVTIRGLPSGASPTLDFTGKKVGG